MICRHTLLHASYNLLLNCQTSQGDPLFFLGGGGGGEGGVPLPPPGPPHYDFPSMALIMTFLAMIRVSVWVSHKKCSQAEVMQR